MQAHASAAVLQHEHCLCPLWQVLGALNAFIGHQAAAQATGVLPNKLLDMLLAVSRWGIYAACNCQGSHRWSSAATPAAAVSHYLQSSKAAPF